MACDNSSTECPVARTEGGHCFQHASSRCCGCGVKQPAKSALMCTCGHSRNWHPKANGGACMGDNCLDCAEFRCDHTRCGWKPREEKPSTQGDFIRCRCGHFQMNHRTFMAGGCINCACKAFALGEQEEPEPPLTPEEEEQAPEDERCGCGHSRAHCDAFETCDGTPKEIPPQPDRRPPVAVAYSVQGHLYEVALPGDATVQAVDGALVIQHALGPVAGIVRVTPLNTEEQ
jgi:hypothetical protein